MDWYRCYHGTPFDPKWRVVAKRVGIRPGDVAAIWSALLDYASQAEDRGSVEGFDFETAAEGLGYPVEHVRGTYETLCNAGLVSERFRLVSWERRQPKREDRSTERVRKHRAEKKGKSTDETHVTNDETRKPPRTEQSREENKSARGARDDVSILGKTKRRLTDEERALASAVNGGNVPWETTDAEVALWRERAQRKQAAKGALPAAVAPPTPAEPVALPAIDPAWSGLDIPEHLRRTA